MEQSKRILGAILGLAVGDALGVPVEFTNRKERAIDPVTDMRAYGSHNQPAGTWSDDTSMTLCLADSLAAGYSPKDVMDRFLLWYRTAAYTAGDKVFDVGRTCSHAINRYERYGRKLRNCAKQDEFSNGNGALMRILPLLFHLQVTYGERFVFHSEARERIREITQLTHAHCRCTIANGIYLSVANRLCMDRDIMSAVEAGTAEASETYGAIYSYEDDMPAFARLLSLKSFCALPESDIISSGYVVHTLEAALWCLLTTDSFAACVLEAVNLGRDADTVGAVAGGLAGLYYGPECIPADWLSVLQRREYLTQICEKLSHALSDAQRTE